MCFWIDPVFLHSMFLIILLQTSHGGDQTSSRGADEGEPTHNDPHKKAVKITCIRKNIRWTSMQHLPTHHTKQPSIVKIHSLASFCYYIMHNMALFITSKMWREKVYFFLLLYLKICADPPSPIHFVISKFTCVVVSSIQAVRHMHEKNILKKQLALTWGWTRFCCKKHKNDEEKNGMTRAGLKWQVRIEVSAFAVTTANGAENINAHWQWHRFEVIANFTI